MKLQIIFLDKNCQAIILMKSFIEFAVYVWKSLCEENKSTTEKRKSRRNFFLKKLNIKHLKSIKAEVGEGGVRTCARHGYPHLVIYNIVVLDFD
jgi:hypothetical protein